MNHQNDQQNSIRYSMAMVLAEAVSQVFEKVSLGGFAISEEGFCYDFALPRSIVPEDLERIQEKMQEIIRNGCEYQFIKVDTDKAREMFHAQPYKLEQIDDLLLDSKDAPVSVVKAGEFYDICEEGRLCPIKDLDLKAFRLLRFSGAYWKGDSQNPMLQRIYGTAWSREAELKEHLKKLEEAAKRDHRVLGTQLSFFSMSPEIGQGLALWHPKGAMVRYLLEKFSQAAHILNGYEWVYTPHIGRSELWKTSTHLSFYKDSMYSPIEIDNEEYYLKPMSCPFHIMIYNSSVKSYKELPVRYAEYATVYRYELSGALQGLTRVRGFTQDDAHIICTPDQMQAEVINALKFSLYMLKSFGLHEFKAYVATKPETESIGSEKEWNDAIESLKSAVIEAGLTYEMDVGGGAFYGPKIDLKLKDSLGREWQCSTIQYDFNLPERFQMAYIGPDGAKHTPMMVHRALFGSLERFFAMLVEHYNGDFPFWLAPVQIGIVPVSTCHNEYAVKLLKKLKVLGLRASMDTSDDKMRAKIRRMELEKIPVQFVVGDQEAAGEGVSVRSRKDGNLGYMMLEEFLQRIKPELELGTPKYLDI